VKTPALLLSVLASACAPRLQEVAPRAPIVREITTPRRLETGDSGAILLPSPTGPYRVGRATFHAIDPARDEPFTLDSADHREVLFHLWYPAGAEGGAPAAFVRPVPQDTVFQRYYRYVGVEKLARVRVHAFAEAPLAEAVRRYPVILFSHGLGALAAMYTTFLENLASHGFIVVGVDHPFFSTAFQMPDGRTVRNLSRQAFRQRDVIAQAADLAGDKFHMAIWLILASCLFDLLDGRLARLGGNESPFGREFDSLADIVSFGVAPALMVYRIVLHEFARTGWIIASVYLVCGALRLARFNCLAAANSAAANKEFRGFPIPAAAGLIASLTLFMLWLAEGERQLGNWKWVLPPLLIFLSWMMFSGFRYPSFKGINWRTTRSIPRFLAIVIVIVFTALNYEWMPFVLFLSYLLYGFLRPFLSRQMKQEIEEELEDEDEPLESP